MFVGLPGIADVGATHRGLIKADHRIPLKFGRLGLRNRGRSEQNHGARNDDREDQGQETCI